MAKGGPLRSHSTETSEGAWNGSRAEAMLGDADERTLRRAYAWADPGADRSKRSAYKFIHHEVARDGTVGAASVRGCINGIGVLNGARGGADIPAEDRKGVYRHLARHLDDAGREPAELK